MKQASYIFTTQRLGFRTWQDNDLPSLLQMNQDEQVMRHFPTLPDEKDCRQFMEKMNLQQEEKGYCYWAVELLESNEFIGFIGLSDQHYKAPFTPCIDIGWRLKKEFWGMGLAPEGAEACFEYGKNQLGLKEIFAVAPKINEPSIRVMEKIGMINKGRFKHPTLTGFPMLRDCVYYLKSLS
ncbi:GNAT family N-acetyltransferase [Persicobacter sp. CCB-QB2]|uniref:GNAT family N-acetyltransferase n=1 Tax=Persicobacter sp. CCB-QB2 TaxID=1561025 RepID=UPI0006A9CFF2|nr:GNAT family N-acetyltransferase [Persicobacter sp. CCB-QB2]